MNGILGYTTAESNEAPICPAPSADAPLTWSRWYEALRVVGHPPYLKRTVRIALIVGLVLFTINHLDEVIAGRATAGTCLKGIVTLFVPFIVANLGVLVASRRPR
jgi:hypothetical protein